VSIIIKNWRKEKMKSIFKRGLFLSMVFILSGCATLFGPDKYDVYFDSEPQGADIRLNGSRVGKTPTSIPLKADKSYAAEFSLQGYPNVTAFINTKIAAKWIVLDIFAGIIGVVVDASSGSWNEFDQTYIKVYLDESKLNDQIDPVKPPKRIVFE
jgi:hypothetical protein